MDAVYQRSVFKLQILAMQRCHVLASDAVLTLGSSSARIGIGGPLPAICEHPLPSVWHSSTINTTLRNSALAASKTDDDFRRSLAASRWVHPNPCSACRFSCRSPARVTMAKLPLKAQSRRSYIHIVRRNGCSEPQGSPHPPSRQSGIRKAGRRFAVGNRHRPLHCCSARAHASRLCRALLPPLSRLILSRSTIYI